MLISANIFQPLIDVFEAVLKFFHNSVGVSWGFSIVLLTVVIRAALLPLALRQFHSMQKLQRLQPQMKALQAKYKDDKQRQQQEMMKFYKENEVNPLASCLPLAAQLPVFLSLFYMLRKDLRTNICPGVQRAYHLGLAPFSKTHSLGDTTACGIHHGANFLFIGDLTNKAVGATLIVLIVLYVGTQLLSTVMMASPTMDKSQQRMMMVLPLFFVVFILSFPAGVIVYWITTNAWTILQQYIVRRRLGPMGGPPTAPPEAATNGSGTPGNGGLASLLRPRAPQPAPAGVGATPGSSGSGSGAGSSSGTRTAPPPPPRKKKKRSGRRR